MQTAIQLFEQDFARWGLHVREADAAARRSGAVHESGWHVLYDFGQDSRGEFLDYYAALRDTTDPAVTDDWHVRLYETGARVQLPTVLEAYMYARDPTREELVRARRKFTDPQSPTAPAKPASAPAATPKAASTQPSILQPAPAAPRMAEAKPGVSRPAAAPVAPARQPAPATSTMTALEDRSAQSGDIALEVGLDLALAGVEPAPGGDTLASWLMTPAFGSGMVEPAKAAVPAPTPTPSQKPKPAAPADDDVQASDLVFVAEPPPERISGRISSPTAAITTDDDTFTISMIDDETPNDVQSASRKDALASDSLGATTIEGLDHGHTPTRSSGRVHTRVIDALATNGMQTTDIAAVAGSFDPWWYRPTTRRIAMLAAAVIAIILVGSAVSHFRSSPGADAASSRHPATLSATHTAAATPASDVDTDATGASDSVRPAESSTPDSLPVASAPSSVTADPANPAADDGIARPAGPQSVPPIRRSGMPRAPLGSGKTTAKAGTALP